VKLRTSLAASTAAVLALGGIAVGGSAAVAASPESVYVPLSDIAVPENSTEESTVYNRWHFDPDHQDGASQADNGLLVEAGGDILVMHGNGNDVAGTEPTDDTTIQQLAASLDIVSSDDSQVWYQIPVFFNGSEGEGEGEISWSFTTLRKQASDASDQWTTSSTVGTIPAQGSANLSTFEEEFGTLGNDARPIGAGFLVEALDPVLVSSFTASGETTYFYPEPGFDTKANQDGKQFVHADDIDPEETDDTYVGWHQGVAPEEAGEFSSVEGENGAISGLLVNGRSQILYGYAEEDYPANSLGEIVDTFHISTLSSANPEGFTAQFPVFYYVDGVIGQQFTTLRATIGEDGSIVDNTWYTSRAVNGVSYADASLDEILDAFSSYQVIGHGFYIQSGSVIVQDIVFNGYDTTFAKSASETPAQPEQQKGPEQIANTGSGDLAPLAISAALALMLAGGVALAVRRARA